MSSDSAPFTFEPYASWKMIKQVKRLVFAKGRTQIIIQSVNVFPVREVVKITFFNPFL